MNEKEINAIIKSIKDENGPQEIVKIEVPDLLDIISEKDVNNTKSDVNIRNLSIEDNSTLAGTANILDDLAQDFGIPCKLNRECIPFDNSSNTIDIVEARSHFEFLCILHMHQDNIADLHSILESNDTRMTQELAVLADVEEEGNSDNININSINTTETVEIDNFTCDTSELPLTTTTLVNCKAEFEKKR